MMRFRLAAFADVHLGNHKRHGGPIVASLNERCRFACDVFRRAVRRAEDLQVDMLLVIGDLFDYSRPEAPLVSLVGTTFKESSTPTYLLVGNHDQVSTSPGDHALGPLALSGAFIVEAPELLRTAAPGSLEVIAVPFRPGHAREWLPGAVRDTLAASGPGATSSAKKNDCVRLLAIHLGIKDAKTAPWLAASPDSIDLDILTAICEEHEIDIVLAGNWHDRRQWRLKTSCNTVVVQIGALVPTGWDNPGLEGYGGLAIVDSEADELVRVEEISGPRFVKVQTKKEAQVAMVEARKKACELYLSFDAPPVEMPELLALVEASKSRGDIHAGEVMPNREEALVQAKSAAFAAKSSKTLDAAVANFVKRMPLPEYVSRDAVLSRTRNFIR